MAGEPLPGRGIEVDVFFFIIDIKFQEVMGQGIVEYGVLCVHPFSVHDITVPKHPVKRVPVYGSPLFHQIIMPLPVAAGEIMAPTLEQDPPAFIKRNAGIRPVAFFLYHEMLSLYFRKTNLR